jgi:hypothetical protein
MRPDLRRLPANHSFFGVIASDGRERGNLRGGSEAKGWRQKAER